MADPTPSTAPPTSTSKAQVSPPLRLRVAQLRALENDPATGRAQGPDSKTNPPSKKYRGDAGLDLEVSQHRTVMPGATVRLTHNIAIQLPDDCFAMIMPRSSTLPDKRLMVIPGQLDGGYRGEVQTVVFNPTKTAIQVHVGERLSQLIIMPLLNVSVEIVPLDSLTPSDRSAAGFGSTGGLTNTR